MNRIHNAPRGAKKIFYNGQWLEVIHLAKDNDLQINLKAENNFAHGNSIKAAQKIMALPEAQRDKAIRSRIAKQKEKELKEITPEIKRMCAAVRETYKQFLEISEAEVEQEIEKLSLLLA